MSSNSQVPVEKEVKVGRKKRTEKILPLYQFDKGTFGAHMKEIRKNAGDSQIELAEKLKITSAMLGLYEKGSSFPPLDTLYNFAKIYGVSIDYLMGLSDIPTPQKKESSPCPMLPALEEFANSNAFILQVKNGELKILQMVNQNPEQL